MRATPEMLTACITGQAARLRCGCGGTEAAVAFAALVTGKSHDFSDEQVAMVAEAHRRLDARLVADGEMSEGHKVEFLLWGGWPAKTWAGVDGLSLQAELEPEPIRARADDLTDALAPIDAELAIRIATLAEATLLNALKAAGAAIAAHLVGPKGSRARRAELVELLGASGFESFKAELAACPDKAKCSLVPASVRAQVTERERSIVERIVAGVADQIDSAIRAAQQAAHRVLQRFTGQPVPTDVRSRAEDDRADAVAFAVLSLTQVTIERLDNPDADVDANGITQGLVPDDFVRSTIGIAGGLPHNQQGVRLDADQALVDPTGRPRPTGVALSQHTLDTLDVAVQDADVRSLLGVPALAQVVIEHTWVSTKREFDPHAQLAGRSWTTEQERAEVCAADPGDWPYVAIYRPNPNPDHKGCGCYTQPRIRIE